MNATFKLKKWHMEGDVVYVDKAELIDLSVDGGKSIDTSAVQLQWNPHSPQDFANWVAYHKERQAALASFADALGGKVKEEMSSHKWPRVRDLPEHEREPFDRWLWGQTRPEINGVPDSEQDGYYQGDYLRWKEGLPVVD